MNPATQTLRHQPESHKEMRTTGVSLRPTGMIRSEWMNPRAAWIVGVSITFRDDCNCPDDCPRDHENE